MQHDAPNDDTRTALQQFKAKIVRIHSTRLQHLLADNNAAERNEDEQPTGYNLLQMRRRRNERSITALRDPESIAQMTPRGIAQALATYPRGKYARIEVNTDSIQRLLKEIEMDLANQDSNDLVTLL